jgi:heterodisulfide reductase subunit C
VLMAIHGQEEELLSENSVIWECTNCYNCYERCPQDVRPVEVIVALKNLATKRKINPEKISNMVNSVTSTGRTARVTGATDRIRGELGLKSIPLVPMEELKKIL